MQPYRPPVVDATKILTRGEIATVGFADLFFRAAMVVRSC